VNFFPFEIIGRTIENQTGWGAGKMCSIAPLNRVNGGLIANCVAGTMALAIIVVRVNAFA